MPPSENDNQSREPGSTHSDLSGISRDVVQAGSVSGGVHFHAHSAQDNPGGRVPRQLPAGVSGFVNRTDELRDLDEVLAGERPERPVVYVIAGTAGAGKTSLTLRWANQAQGHFPDGQLYINLRGYDPGKPITALEALHRFLTALGVPAAALPPDTEAAAAMYRSAPADRSMLIVLDNAATISQVRPLLPGNSRCLAVVTSRSRLSGLTVHAAARRLTIGTLKEPECVLLLRTVTAGYRPEDEAEQLIELARLCARLPLALRVAAERAASQPHLRIEELIADLRDESALWDTLSTGDEDESGAVRTVFAWSYRALPADSARLFRLLGLHPGPDFGVGAVCALAEIDTRRARQLLDGLVAAHMLEQTGPGRFEFHDLLRAYAIDQARVEESDESRAAALRRLLEWYLHTAGAAQTWIRPSREHVPFDEPAGGVKPLSFTDYDQAVDWAEQEQFNFLPAIRAAVKAGLDRHAWRFALVLWSAKAPSTPAAEWLTIGQIGLEAARRAGEPLGEAELFRSLGFTHVKINNMAGALESHGGALAIQRDLGHRQGEATALNALGLACLRWRRLPEAEAHFREAAAVFESLNSPHWNAVVLANLAAAHCQAGRLPEATDAIHRVLAYQREKNNKRSIGNALHLKSGVHLDRGELDEALQTAQEAVELALDLRSHVLEGYWLLALGHAQLAAGKSADALVSFHRSATLHRRLGDRSREALAWNGAGAVHQHEDRPEEAADFHRRAAATQHELGFHWHEAMALDGLAIALTGVDAAQSRRRWTDALELISYYDDPRAQAVRQRMEHHLTQTG
ncbi:ATP-binding protein [Sinosporangium siamense]|uniref:Tetratricopeptide repeat protein n=1 Tax=Sinosporangium siamense TaxID=1367973 RepID=A0A919RE39_9ACTN|nr:tetratricopeptide repeat protein [Sinosporangium siamense]GII90734.1 hypothetical protein Ssi02_09650 [Sinosporangium siamense]